MSGRRHLEHSLLPPECLVYMHEENLSKIDSARARVEEALDHLDTVEEFSEPDLVTHRASEREILVQTSLKSPINLSGCGLWESEISPERITDLDALRKLLCTTRALFDRKPITQWTPEILHWFTRRRSLLGQLREDLHYGEVLRTPWKAGTRIKRDINGRRPTWDQEWISDEQAGSTGRPMVLHVKIKDFGWRISVDFARMYRIGDIDTITAMRAIASEGPCT